MFFVLFELWLIYDLMIIGQPPPKYAGFYRGIEDDARCHCVLCSERKEITSIKIPLCPPPTSHPTQPHPPTLWTVELLIIAFALSIKLPASSVIYAYSLFYIMWNPYLSIISTFHFSSTSFKNPNKVGWFHKLMK